MRRAGGAVVLAVQVLVGWAVDPTESQPVTHVQVERQAGPAWVRITAEPMPATRYVDTVDPVPGEALCYRVIPSNADGEGPPSAVACATAPGPPTKPLGSVSVTIQPAPAPAPEPGP